MRGIWRLLAPLSFALTSARVALWKIVTERPDIVLCIEPTFFVAPAGLLAKFTGARTILHVQDLEIDAAFAVGHLEGDRLKSFVLRLESWLLRRFSSVITLSGQMRERLIAKGVAANRIGLVRNWVDLTKIKPLAEPNVFRAELGLSGADFAVLYAGNIGAKQALGVVLDAARQLAGVAQVHFVIAGDGPEKQHLMQSYADLPNVHFLPLQPEERLCELLNLANLHVLPQSRGAADLVLPSKLGGMLASGKPVLATADANIPQPVPSNRAHWHPRRQAAHPTTLQFRNAVETSCGNAPRVKEPLPSKFHLLFIGAQTASHQLRCSRTHAHDIMPG